MFALKSQYGFSLVELLSTIAVVAALSGVSMAVYVQYQDRAYLSASLQQGVQLRTAFEAGLSGQSSLGSTIFNENRNFQFLIDGTQSCDNCSGYSFSDLFVGFSPQRGVGSNFSVADTQSYSISTAHCRNAIEGTDSADGWIVSDEQASVAAAISMSSDHIRACSDVLVGGAIPTPTVGPSCGDSLCNGSETAGDCPGDCPENCGDGYCTHSENSGSCSADCGGDGCSCGDTNCNAACGENQQTCCEDCSPSCGDLVCNCYENSDNCPGDCGGGGGGPTCGDGLCAPEEFCSGGTHPSECAADCNGGEPCP